MAFLAALTAERPAPRFVPSAADGATLKALAEAILGTVPAALLDDETDPANQEAQRLTGLLSRVLAYAAAADRTIAEQRARIADLEAQSRTDPLTGLLNRRGLMAALERAVARANHTRHHGLLLYGDLDGFKTINDRHGHRVGDLALQAVAACIRGHGPITAARLGGDEFTIIVEGSSAGDVESRAAQIMHALDAVHLAIDADTSIAIKVSLGTCPIEAGAAPTTLLDQADGAMYRAKARRTGCPRR